MLFYIFVLRFLNLITDKCGMEKTPCLGLLMITIGCLFVYPVFPIPKSIILILIGLCLIGGAGAPLNVPGLINMSNFLKFYDKYLDDPTANDIASTLYIIANNIGNFIGPTFGGFLSSKFGFEKCCLFLSILFFIYLIFYYLIFRNSEEIKPEKSLIEIINDMNVVLLNNDKKLNKIDKSYTFFGNTNNLYKYHSFYITRKFTSLKTIKKKKLINYNLLPSSTY